MSSSPTRLGLGACVALAIALAGGAVSALAGGGAEAQDARALEDGAARVLEALRIEGVHVDPTRGYVAFEARVGVRDHLLEHALCAEGGETHEALFVTRVTPSVLNTGLLVLGLEPGRPPRWLEDEPPPAEGRSSVRATPPRVELPAGDGLYVYVAWRQGEELYLHRIEDLIENLATGRTMQRHRWVYLGSRMILRDNLRKESRGLEEVYAADVLRDLINVTFYYDGAALLTAALLDCRDQNLWAPIAVLLPPQASPVELVLSRERLAQLPADLLERLPVLDEPARRSAREAESGEGRTREGAGAPGPR